MSEQIIITKTEESPALSSASLLPIMRFFANAAGIDIIEKDISLASRILQVFHDDLPSDQRVTADIDYLRADVVSGQSNIIKLPNLSATENQLVGAIKELQNQGYNLPDYPATPNTAKEKQIKEKYDSVTGSVVNPILRQGNAIRSIPDAVKKGAQQNPHSMGHWKNTSKTRVAHMDQDDFYHTEKSVTLDLSESEPLHASYVSVYFVSETGEEQCLKSNIETTNGDVIDAATLSRRELSAFLDQAFEVADQNDLLLSLHLKATMMKKTDGVIFGDVVAHYFAPVFEKHKAVFEQLSIDPQNGLNGILRGIETLDNDLKTEILQDIEECFDSNPSLAMTNAKAGLNHLSAANLNIVDISMANLARWGGEVSDKNGNFGDTLAVIPDSTYARMHQTGIDFMKQNGSADPKTLGTVKTLRLQAGGAEEYGSKDKTFVAPDNGKIIIRDHNDDTVTSHNVEKGDLWRMCQTHDDALENWIDIALDQAQKQDDPVVFWLDEDRPHDAEVIAKIQNQLKSRSQNLNTANISWLKPEEAMTYTLDRSYKGLDTFIATGNLIGDHVTDYFPIQEIGTSAKMLSVVKLLAGGIVAETGSGGTAPDLLDLVKEKNHFLWDDTGTMLALAESLETLSASCKNAKALILANALSDAIEKYVLEQKSPSPNGLDTRESHYFLTRYWAQAIANQTEDLELQTQFKSVADALLDNEAQILAELSETRGQTTDIGDHYNPSENDLNFVMRPSATLNKIIP